MTIFGRLLVWMNLLFAVFTGALIVFVFTTRANWVAAYKDAEGKAKTAEAAYKAERGAHESDLRQKEAESAGLKEQVKQLQTAVETAQQEARSARELASKHEGLNTAANTQQQKAQTELAQIREERDALVKQQADLRQRIVDIQKQLDGQVEKAVLADLRARNMEQKANNLLRQVEELTVKVRQMEADSLLGGGTGAGAPSITDPPARSAPAGVQGKVTHVGTAGSNLAQIDIGSDSGLSGGNSLTVYRGGEYLGELTLTTVTAKQAVGKFTPSRRGAEVRVGDQVITSFTGTRQ